MRASIAALGCCLSVLLTTPLTRAQEFLWAKQLGGSGARVVAASVAVDAAGNVYTTGVLTGTADFDPGPGTYNLTSASNSDAYISKLDSAGNFVWAKRLGGPGALVIGYGIAVDAAGSVYTVGGFQNGTADFDPGPGTYNLTPGASSDTYISKLDSAGNFVWARQLGGPEDTIGTSVALGADGSVYAAGESSFGAVDEPFVSKLDGSGNFVWTRRFGGTAGGFASGVGPDAAGNVYTVGAFLGAADFDPGPGTYSLVSAGDYDVFISKLDSSGNLVWARQLGGLNTDDGLGVAVDAASNVYATGSFSGTADFDPGPGTYNLTAAGSNDAFIARLDSAGNLVWAEALGGTAGVEGRNVSVDGTGNVYTVGGFTGTADFNPGPGTYNLTATGSTDAFFSKVDSAGNFLWAGRLGGADFDYAWGVAVDGSGNVHTVGRFQGTADFDPGPGSYNLTAAGSNDAFISKLKGRVNNCAGQPDGILCDDGNACTRTDICQSGICTGSNPVVCTALDQCHVTGTCNTSTGICSHPDAPDNTFCNDGNACTVGDRCLAGLCHAGPLRDADGDGHTDAQCGGDDCDDADSSTYPGAPEINDGKDNQCTGDPGFGIIDEVSGNSGFLLPGDPNSFCWTAQPQATSYEVVRSTDREFRSGCSYQVVVSGTCWSDPQQPTVGQAFYYLVRALAPNEGSWGKDGSGAELSAACLVETACSDGIDNDGDQLTDCADPDCVQDPACTHTFAFTDTLGDDVAPDALYQFFAGFQVLPTDYVLFLIDEPNLSSVNAWCSERADFYRDGYLANATGGSFLFTQGWALWWSNFNSNFQWLGPDHANYPNGFGFVCGGRPYTWCSMSGLGGLPSRVVDPGLTNPCEAYDPGATGCGDGTWGITIRVAPTRQAACGF